jgi:hypothetical protein
MEDMIWLEESFYPPVFSLLRETSTPFAVWIAVFCALFVTLYLTIFSEQRARKKREK